MAEPERMAGLMADGIADHRPQHVHRTVPEPGPRVGGAGLDITPVLQERLRPFPPEDVRLEDLPAAGVAEDVALGVRFVHVDVTDHVHERGRAVQRPVRRFGADAENRPAADAFKGPVPVLDAFLDIRVPFRREGLVHVEVDVGPPVEVPALRGLVLPASPAPVLHGVVSGFFRVHRPCGHRLFR